MVLSEDEVLERRWSPLEGSQVFPILRSSPSPSATLSRHRFLLGWSGDLQPWVAKHFQEDTPPPPRPWKLTWLWYISRLRPDSSRTYPFLCLAPRNWFLATDRSHFSFRPRSGLSLLDCAFCLAPTSVLFRRENFCRICASRWRASYYRLLLRPGITGDVFNFFHLLALLFFSYFAAFFSRLMSLKYNESFHSYTIFFCFMPS